MRIAIYTRVSTEDQAREGFSIDAQIRKLTNYVEMMDHDLVRRYSDLGCTGRNTKRSEYRRMFREADQWDAILITKLDRIHRNTKNFILMMDHLRSQDKDLIAMEEDLNTSTALGRFFIDMISRIAQLESEQIGERVLSGMAEKALSNPLALGGQRPYGYKKIPQEDKSVVLEIIEEEAEVIRQIFHWDADIEILLEKYPNPRGGILSLISRTLNARGTTSPQGKRWSAQGIKNILSREAFYQGLEASWGGIRSESDHPGILEPPESPAQP